MRITREDVLNNFCVFDLRNASALSRIIETLEHVDSIAKRVWTKKLNIIQNGFSFSGTARSLKAILAVRARIK